MLVWNGFMGWCLLILALVGLDPALFERYRPHYGHHCPRCGYALQARGRLELLSQRADRYVGWRTFRCNHCSYQQTGLAISRDPCLVVYQTHRVN